MTAEELGLQAPTFLTFMPSKRIFLKLIKRATQINDIIEEINPKEAKFKEDPDKKGDCVQISGLVVYGRDDPFNALRVFPPDTLNYPEFLRDKDSFYKKIGRPDLK